LENPRADFALFYPMGEEMEQFAISGSMEDFVMYPESVEKIIKCSMETQDVAEDLVAELSHTVAVWFQMQAILVVVRKVSTELAETDEAQHMENEVNKLKVLIEEFMCMGGALTEEKVCTAALRALEEHDPTIEFPKPDHKAAVSEMKHLLASGVLFSSESKEKARRPASCRRICP